MHVLVNGVRLFFDVEGAKLVPDGPTMRERPANAPRRPRLRSFDLQACILEFGGYRPNYLP
jgi:hypothetical protein